MATSTNIVVPGVSNRRLQGQERCQRTRRTTFEAGRGLEMLGHAIEYLTDEYVHEAKELSAIDPQVAAIRLPMNLNRQVYYECPVILKISEPFCAFLFGVRA